MKKELCKYAKECGSFNKNRKDCIELKKRSQGCVSFNERETGINYGCLPCSNLHSKKCKGEKPNSFYYPHECHEFYNEEQIQMEEEYEFCL